MTFSATPATPDVGDTVTVTYTGSTGSVNSSPSARAAGTIQVQVLVGLSGAMTGNVVATTAPGSYPATSIDPFSTTGAYSATTSFTATKSGGITLTAKQRPAVSTGTARVVMNGGLDTYCSTAAGNFPNTGSDPTVASTLLAGYTPNLQAGTDDAYVSAPPPRSTPRRPPSRPSRS